MRLFLREISVNGTLMHHANPSRSPHNALHSPSRYPSGVDLEIEEGGHTYGVRIDVVHARILAARIVHSILGGREGGHAPLIVFVPLVITRVHSTSLMCTKPYVTFMQSFK